MEKAIFAGGCFWCMQPPYDEQKGVLKVVVGYIGSMNPNPTYEQICTGATGHYEAVEIDFDPQLITYEQLLEIFWKNIDPTNPVGQFADVGSQYKTAIFYHDDKQQTLAQESKLALEESGKFDKPIVTEILPATPFYIGEDYHQSYYKKEAAHYDV